MNANELADELETRYKYAEASECMLDAATMLRRLQAEKEVLKKELNQWKALSNFDAKTLEDCNTIIDQQQAEIEVLKRQVGILKQDVANWMDNAGQHPDEQYWERLLK